MEMCAVGVHVPRSSCIAPEMFRELNLAPRTDEAFSLHNGFTIPDKCISSVNILQSH